MTRTAFRVESRDTASSRDRHGARCAASRSSRWRRAPFWGGRADLRLLAEIYAYLALASCGTCSPAMPAWSRSASRPSSASAATCCSRSTIFAAPSAPRVPLAGVSPRARGAAGRASLSSACAAPISRSAPGWSPRSSACSLAQIVRARRRLRHQPARRRRAPIAAEPADARVRDLLVALALVVAVLGAHRRCCCARATAWR